MVGHTVDRPIVPQAAPVPSASLGPHPWLTSDCRCRYRPHSVSGRTPRAREAPATDLMSSGSARA